MTSFIKLTQLNKYFGQQHILKNIDLEIKQGDFVAITGASGSGKSTLLSIIGLLENFEQGVYKLLDKNVTNFDEYQLSQLRNKNLGWIFQNFNLIDEMSVLDNVILPLRYSKNCSHSEQQKAGQQALQLVGLNDKSDAKPTQLSGGQQQRVAIARAIINKPELILADEPTGNLDSKSQEGIFQLLVDLNKQGATVILVTHANDLSKYCHRIIQMQDGIIINDHSNTAKA